MFEGRIEPLDTLRHFSAYVENFKCFKTPQGFDSFRPMNILVGQNNAGKTALLEFVEMLCSGQSADDIPRDKWNGRNIPRFTYTYTFHPEVFHYLRNANGQINTRLHEFSHLIVDKLMGIKVRGVIERNGNWAVDRENIKDIWVQQGFQGERIRYKGDFINDGHVDSLVNDFIKWHTPHWFNAFKKCTVRNLSADRNIKPEGIGALADFDSDGTDATNLIRHCLMTQDYPTDEARDVLLERLNRVFNPEMTFTDIEAYINEETNQYEIHLTERYSGRVRLGNMGSGVKTVLLIILHLTLGPWSGTLKNTRAIPTGRWLNNHVFLFEEVENNMHPGAQRRLLEYLAKTAKEHGCMFFIATHSHIAIDQFAKDDDAQIIHVRRDESGEAIAENVTTHSARRNVFRDLDVRASDLLQSNAIIWVEGPSDRVYLNRWIDLHSDHELQENVHYQILHTSGSILAHFFFGDPEDITDEEVKEMIHVLRINPHSILLADSDRKRDGDTLKPAVLRIEEEMQKTGEIFWITAGKEIENYIPPAILGQLYPGTDIEALGDLTQQDIFEVIYRISGSKAKEPNRDKMKLAEKVCPLLTRENMGHLDIREKVQTVCDAIYRWNHKTPAVQKN